jgi:hypothetical protein
MSSSADAVDEGATKTTGTYCDYVQTSRQILRDETILLKAQLYAMICLYLRGKGTTLKFVQKNVM